MITEERMMEAAKLRLRLQMNSRLRLEALAALSKVFREYDEPVEDDLLAALVFAVPEELLGEMEGTQVRGPKEIALGKPRVVLAKPRSGNGKRRRKHGKPRPGHGKPRPGHGKPRSLPRRRRRHKGGKPRPMPGRRRHHKPGKPRSGGASTRGKPRPIPSNQ